MEYEIKNRFTGEVQFTAEIDCDESAGHSLKAGLSVQWAIENGANLRGANLRRADLGGADLRRADLRRADLGGADLRYARLRFADLRNADLRYADLRNADLRYARLRRAYMGGADLGGADLRNADLRNARLRFADLRYADLGGASLTGADLTGANLGDFPVTIKNIHQTVFDAASKDGALDMGEWHCGTSHCRAGWVVTLAGPAGKALEWAYDTPTAAALIYAASDPLLENTPEFYCDNETALADMKRLAELEANR